jgi:molybdopterin adenylyltransferase
VYKAKGTKIAVLTVSDGVTLGVREDLSGKLALGIIEAGLHPDILTDRAVPDDLKQIADTLRGWADDGYRLIVTSGGTGISPRDNTPQATLSVIDYEVPGIAELMRSESLKKTASAALSRAVAGVRGRTLIINLPGSPKGVQECLDAVMPILPHAIEQLESGAGHTK